MDAEAGVEPAAPTFRASSPYRYRVLGNGGLDGSRTRYLRLDKAAPPRLRPRDPLKNFGWGIADVGLVARTSLASSIRTPKSSIGNLLAGRRGVAPRRVALEASLALGRGP